MSQMILNLFSKLDEMVNHNPLVRQVIADPQGIILTQEMNIFVYRLALINSWAMVILDEISSNSSEVYDQLDDWIVIAVQEENSITQQVMSAIKESIQNELTRIEEYQTSLSTLSLMGKINIRQFSNNEVPKYLKNLLVPTDQIESIRFSSDQLRSLYCQMRFNTGEKGSLDTLDQDSFVNIMLLAYRQGQVPISWKYTSVDKILGFSNLLSIQPITGP